MNDQVLLGYVHDDQVDSIFMAAKDRLMREEPRITGSVGIHSGPKVDDARNELFKVWLEETSADYMMMVDTDMVLRADQVDRLMNHRKEIAGGLYFTGGFNTPKRPHIYVIRESEEDGVPRLHVWWDYPRNTLVEVNGTGGGCLLVTRRAAKQVWEARGKDHPMPWFAFGMHNGVKIGEDIAFCLTAGKLGISSFVDTSLVIGHIKLHIVGEEEYVTSLMDEAHPYYAKRKTVPIYRELIVGDSGINSDRPSNEGISAA